jgi:hypothetical protein
MTHENVFVVRVQRRLVPPGDRHVALAVRKRKLEKAQVLDVVI